MKPLRIRVVSDVICPWCYIGKRRLEQALRQLPRDSSPEVVWSPFELNPDMPPQGMERKEYRSAKFGSWKKSEEMDEQVALIGRSEGIAFDFPKIKRTPNTFAAHCLIWSAGKRGKQDAIVEALFRRYFVEGDDIGDPDVLTAVASECGMLGLTASELVRGDGAPAAVARESESARLSGISAVPTFILNESLAVSGAQTPEALVAAFHRAADASALGHLG